MKEVSTATGIRRAEEKVEALELMLKMTTDHMSAIQCDLTIKKEQLEESAKHINDSLLFSSILQKAIMPSEKDLALHFKNFLLYYKQKEAIGGDLLWVRERKGYTYLACIDCTGHGVPGAMLSMAAHFSLNNTFDRRKYTDPVRLLEDFNEQFYKHFHLHENDNEGMNHGLDIGLVIINPRRTEMRYAGTHQSLVSTDENGLQVYRGSRGYVGNKELHVEKSHRIRVEKGTKYFMFTDGISDQFGGPRNKKFLSKRMRALLQKTHSCGMPQQSDEMVKTLNQWQGTEEQTDDMLLVGFTL